MRPDSLYGFQKALRELWRKYYLTSLVLESRLCELQLFAKPMIANVIRRVSESDLADLIKKLLPSTVGLLLFDLRRIK